MTESEMVLLLVNNYTQQLAVYQELKESMKRIRQQLALSVDFNLILGNLRQRNVLFHKIESLDSQIKEQKTSWETHKNGIFTTEAEILRARLKQIQNLLDEIMAMEHDLENTINRLSYARHPIS
jgi:archaellum component FlaC